MNDKLKQLRDTMLKYTDTEVVFAEIPDEITLAINISNCPCHCKGCHSPYLAEDIGEELSLSNLITLYDRNKGITCISLMGGDSDPSYIDVLAEFIKNILKLKVAWYSGRQELSKDIDLGNFDFIKLGPYIPEKGGLDSRTTNQRFYHIVDGILIDKTELFWH